MEEHRKYIEAVRASLKEYAHGSPVFEPLAVGDYGDISRVRYDDASRKFLKAGFSSLGDYSMRDSPSGNRAFTFIRMFLSGDGGVSAAYFYHPSIGGIFDLDTEFDDGSFVLTTTAPRSSLLLPPVVISRISLKPQVPFRALVAIHLARVFKHRVFKRLRVSKKFSSEDVIAAQKRQEAIKRAEMKFAGRLSKRQLDELMKPVDGALLPEVEQALLEKWQS
jgi:hypothetical protein